MAAEQSTVIAKPEVLLLDLDALAGSHLPVLREHYQVILGHSVVAAAEYLRRAPSTCDFIISDIRREAEATFGLFRTAKSLVPRPTILITTADAERVPDALISGADAVLLKPFPPNLLFSRLGRLKQQRDARKHSTTAASVDDAVHIHCPHCNAAGAVTFDFVSYRRAWHACLACKKVWIAKCVDR